MATLVKQYTFTASTVMDDDQVNANFDDAYTFLNNSVSHLDGSKAFTGIPTLPAVDPTGDNQPTRKLYVDTVSKLNTVVAARAGLAASQAPTGTWVNWDSTPLGFLFFKQHASTLLVMDVGMSAYMTPGVGAVDVGIQLTSATSIDHQVGRFYFNKPSEHRSFGGQASASLSAGLWVATLRVKVTGNTLVSDANDWVSMSVREAWL